MNALDITDAAVVELARTIIANDYQGEDAHVDLGTCNTDTLCNALLRIEANIRSQCRATDTRHADAVWLLREALLVLGVAYGRSPIGSQEESHCLEILPKIQSFLANEPAP